MQLCRIGLMLSVAGESVTPSPLEHHPCSMVTPEGVQIKHQPVSGDTATCTRVFPP